MSRAAAPPASGTKFRKQILAKPKTLLGRGRSPPKKNFSHKERKVRKEMEGGNGMSEANVVTLQQATQTPSIAVENLSGSRIKSATEIFPARRGLGAGQESEYRAGPALDRRLFLRRRGT